MKERKKEEKRGGGVAYFIDNAQSKAGRMDNSWRPLLYNNPHKKKSYKKKEDYKKQVQLQHTHLLLLITVTFAKNVSLSPGYIIKFSNCNLLDKIPIHSESE